MLIAVFQAPFGIVTAAANISMIIIIIKYFSKVPFSSMREREREKGLKAPYNNNNNNNNNNVHLSCAHQCPECSHDTY